MSPAIHLLQRLIATPSLSRQEDATASLLFDYLQEQGLAAQRQGNNVFVRSRHWVNGQPVILLNSHHDTVKAAAGYTRDPHEPSIENGRLYGLGSNDAGGCLVALIHAFLSLEQTGGLACNLLLAATAEEEISGPNGIASLLPQLGPIDAAIVGEPTLLQAAVAERGLVVLDGETKGESGHAARKEGVNALYRALEDIDRVRQYRFDRSSDFLPATHATVTQIEAGSQHNVVPDRCRFVVDLRVNEQYSNEEAVSLLQQQCVHSQLKPRSLRLQSSRIDLAHPLVKAALSFPEVTAYGSPTLSDQALMPFPTLKLGPGDSARSHTADEWIGVDEVLAGEQRYVELLRRAY